MFQYKTLQRHLLEERRKREALQAKLQQTEANTDYIAMMCDVELETENENEGGFGDE